MEKIKRMKMLGKTQALFEQIRGRQKISLSSQLFLAIQLSIPAILAQFSTIIMEYIDASMVGRLGARESASIGLVTTSTWLFASLCAAASSGFSVQVAHLIGAGERRKAKDVLTQAFTSTLVLSLSVALIGAIVSPWLPSWLGGESDIVSDASAYFLIFALSLPALQVDFLAGGMLRCSGNMQIPSLLNVLMCVLDVIFNALLIFPSSHYDLGLFTLFVPGAALGVKGAALGTALAEVVTAALMLYYLVFRSPELNLKGHVRKYLPTRECMKKAFHIGFPMGLEHAVMCGAQIATTIIVAPLGMFAIAANAFAVTAESLCYMPGYGISEASTTLVGQCLGAGRLKLAQRFAYITLALGMIVMTVMGIIMYIAAPAMMAIMTPVSEIQSLGVMALRIEAFAEPMFAAAIVVYGVYVGLGETLVSSVMNLVSMWAVRLTLAALLAPVMGLKGVWIAMCIELCVRGLAFLIRLFCRNWKRRN